MKPRTLLPAAAASLGLLLAACGGGSDRPSASELSDKYEEIGLEEEQADCAGEVLADSDISDGALREFVDADLDAEGDPLDDIDISEDDQEAAEGLDEEFAECIGLDDIEVPETPETEPEG